ncbi:hypothetical protein CE91St43_28060 [Oscillospiraceae bacterium]|nr:hypothetical protein CE91St43_28060 [Oscillospiraceae bacterium]
MGQDQVGGPVGGVLVHCAPEDQAGHDLDLGGGGVHRPLAHLAVVVGAPDGYGAVGAQGQGVIVPGVDGHHGVQPELLGDAAGQAPHPGGQGHVVAAVFFVGVVAHAQLAPDVAAPGIDAAVLGEGQGVGAAGGQADHRLVVKGKAQRGGGVAADQVAVAQLAAGVEAPGVDPVDAAAVRIGLHGQGQGMAAACGHGDDVLQGVAVPAGHLDGRVAVHVGAVAQLAVGVPAPGPHGAVGAQGHGEIVAAGRHGGGKGGLHAPLGGPLDGDHDLSHQSAGVGIVHGQSGLAIVAQAVGHDVDALHTHQPVVGGNKEEAAVGGADHRGGVAVGVGAGAAGVGQHHPLGVLVKVKAIPGDPDQLIHADALAAVQGDEIVLDHIAGAGPRLVVEPAGGLVHQGNAVVARVAHPVGTARGGADLGIGVVIGCAHGRLVAPLAVSIAAPGPDGAVGAQGHGPLRAEVGGADLDHLVVHVLPARLIPARQDAGGHLHHVAGGGGQADAGLERGVLAEGVHDARLHQTAVRIQKGAQQSGGVIAGGQAGDAELIGVGVVIGRGHHGGVGGVKDLDQVGALGPVAPGHGPRDGGSGGGVQQVVVRGGAEPVDDAAVAVQQQGMVAAGGDGDDIALIVVLGEVVQGGAHLAGVVGGRVRLLVNAQGGDGIPMGVTAEIAPVGHGAVRLQRQSAVGAGHQVDDIVEITVAAAAMVHVAVLGEDPYRCVDTFILAAHGNTGLTTVVAAPGINIAVGGQGIAGLITGGHPDDIVEIQILPIPSARSLGAQGHPLGGGGMGGVDAVPKLGVPVAAPGPDKAVLIHGVGAGAAGGNVDDPGQRASILLDYLDGVIPAAAARVAVELVTVAQHADIDTFVPPLDIVAAPGPHRAVGEEGGGMVGAGGDHGHGDDLAVGAVDPVHGLVGGLLGGVRHQPYGEQGLGLTLPVPDDQAHLAGGVIPDGHQGNGAVAVVHHPEQLGGHGGDCHVGGQGGGVVPAVGGIAQAEAPGGPAEDLAQLNGEGIVLSHGDIVAQGVVGREFAHLELVLGGVGRGHSGGRLAHPVAVGGIAQIGVVHHHDAVVDPAHLDRVELVGGGEVAQDPGHGVAVVTVVGAPGPDGALVLDGHAGVLAQGQVGGPVEIPVVVGVGVVTGVVVGVAPHHPAGQRLVGAVGAALPQGSRVPGAPDIEILELIGVGGVVVVGVGVGPQSGGLGGHDTGAGGVGAGVDCPHAGHADLDNAVVHIRGGEQDIFGCTGVGGVRGRGGAVAHLAGGVAAPGHGGMDAIGLPHLGNGVVVAGVQGEDVGEAAVAQLRIPLAGRHRVGVVLPDYGGIGSVIVSGAQGAGGVLAQGKDAAVLAEHAQAVVPGLHGHDVGKVLGALQIVEAVAQHPQVAAGHTGPHLLGHEEGADQAAGGGAGGRHIPNLAELVEAPEPHGAVGLVQGHGEVAPRGHGAHVAQRRGGVHHHHSGVELVAVGVDRAVGGVAPGPDVAVLVQRQGVAVTGGHGHDAGQRGVGPRHDLDRVGAGGGGAVAQLAVIVGAPGVHGAVRLQGDRVGQAGVHHGHGEGGGDGIGDLRHRDLQKHDPMRDIVDNIGNIDGGPAHVVAGDDHVSAHQGGGGHAGIAAVENEGGGVHQGITLYSGQQIEGVIAVHIELADGDAHGLVGPGVQGGVAADIGAQRIEVVLLDADPVGVGPGDPHDLVVGLAAEAAGAADIRSHGGVGGGGVILAPALAAHHVHRAGLVHQHGVGVAAGQGDQVVEQPAVQHHGGGIGGVDVGADAQLAGGVLAPGHHQVSGAVLQAHQGMVVPGGDLAGRLAAHHGRGALHGRALVLGAAIAQLAVAIIAPGIDLAVFLQGHAVVGPGGDPGDLVDIVAVGVGGAGGHLDGHQAPVPGLGVAQLAGGVGAPGIDGAVGPEGKGKVRPRGHRADVGEGPDVLQAVDRLGHGIIEGVGLEDQGGAHGGGGAAQVFRDVGGLGGHANPDLTAVSGVGVADAHRLVGAEGPHLVVLPGDHQGEAGPGGDAPGGAKSLVPGAEVGRLPGHQGVRAGLADVVILPGGAVVVGPGTSQVGLKAVPGAQAQLAVVVGAPAVEVALVVQGQEVVVAGGHLDDVIPGGQAVEGHLGGILIGDGVICGAVIGGVALGHFGLVPQQAELAPHPHGAVAPEGHGGVDPGGDHGGYDGALGHDHDFVGPLVVVVGVGDGNGDAAVEVPGGDQIPPAVGQLLKLGDLLVGGLVDQAGHVGGGNGAVKGRVDEVEAAGVRLDQIVGIDPEHLIHRNSGGVGHLGAQLLLHGAAVAVIDLGVADDDGIVVAQTGLHQQAAVLGGEVAQLAVDVEAGAPHGALLPGHQRIAVARGDGHQLPGVDRVQGGGAGALAHPGGDGGAGGIAAVGAGIDAQLAVSVVAEGPDGGVILAADIVIGHDQRVGFARGDLAGLGQIHLLGNACKGISIAKADAELALAVVAPAVHAPVGQEGQGVPSAGGQVDHIGQVVAGSAGVVLHLDGGHGGLHGGGAQLAIGVVAPGEGGAIGPHGHGVAGAAVHPDDVVQVEVRAVRRALKHLLRLITVGFGVPGAQLALIVAAEGPDVAVHVHQQAVIVAGGDVLDVGEEHRGPGAGDQLVPHVLGQGVVLGADGDKDILPKGLMEYVGIVDNGLLILVVHLKDAQLAVAVVAPAVHQPVLGQGQEVVGAGGHHDHAGHLHAVLGVHVHRHGDLVHGRLGDGTVGLEDPVRLQGAPHPDQALGVHGHAGALPRRHHGNGEPVGGDAVLVGLAAQHAHPDTGQHTAGGVQDGDGGGAGLLIAGVGDLSSGDEPVGVHAGHAGIAADELQPAELTHRGALHPPAPQVEAIVLLIDAAHGPGNVDVHAHPVTQGIVVEAHGGGRVLNKLHRDEAAPVAADIVGGSLMVPLVGGFLAVGHNAQLSHPVVARRQHAAVGGNHQGDIAAGVDLVGPAQEDPRRLLALTGGHGHQPGGARGVGRGAQLAPGVGAHRVGGIAPVVLSHDGDVGPAHGHAGDSGHDKSPVVLQDHGHAGLDRSGAVRHGHAAPGVGPGGPGGIHIIIDKGNGGGGKAKGGDGGHPAEDMLRGHALHGEVRAVLDLNGSVGAVHSQGVGVSAHGVPGAQLAKLIAAPGPDGPVAQLGQGEVGARGQMGGVFEVALAVQALDHHGAHLFQPVVLAQLAQGVAARGPDDPLALGVDAQSQGMGTAGGHFGDAGDLNIDSVGLPVHHFRHLAGEQGHGGDRSGHRCGGIGHLDNIAASAVLALVDLILRIGGVAVGGPLDGVLIAGPGPDVGLVVVDQLKGVLAADRTVRHVVLGAPGQSTVGAEPVLGRHRDLGIGPGHKDTAEAVGLRIVIKGIVLRPLIALQLAAGGGVPELGGDIARFIAALFRCKGHILVIRDQGAGGAGKIAVFIISDAVLVLMGRQGSGGGSRLLRGLLDVLGLASPADVVAAAAGARNGVVVLLLGAAALLFLMELGHVLQLAQDPHLTAGDHQGKGVAGGHGGCGCKGIPLVIKNLDGEGPLHEGAVAQLAVAVVAPGPNGAVGFQRHGVAGPHGDLGLHKRAPGGLHQDAEHRRHARGLVADHEIGLPVFDVVGIQPVGRGKGAERGGGGGARGIGSQDALVHGDHFKITGVIGGDRFQVQQVQAEGVLHRQLGQVDHQVIVLALDRLLQAQGDGGAAIAGDSVLPHVAPGLDGAVGALSHQYGNDARLLCEVADLAPVILTGAVDEAGIPAHQNMLFANGEHVHLLHVVRLLGACGMVDGIVFVKGDARHGGGPGTVHAQVVPAVAAVSQQHPVSAALGEGQSAPIARGDLAHAVGGGAHAAGPADGALGGAVIQAHLLEGVAAPAVEDPGAVGAQAGAGIKAQCGGVAAAGGQINDLVYVLGVQIVRGAGQLHGGDTVLGGAVVAQLLLPVVAPSEGGAVVAHGIGAVPARRDTDDVVHPGAGAGAAALGHRVGHRQIEVGEIGPLHRGIDPGGVPVDAGLAPAVVAPGVHKAALGQRQGVVGPRGDGGHGVRFIIILVCACGFVKVLFAENVGAQRGSILQDHQSPLGGIVVSHGLRDHGRALRGGDLVGHFHLEGAGIAAQLAMTGQTGGPHPSKIIQRKGKVVAGGDSRKADFLVAIHDAVQGAHRSVLIRVQRIRGREAQLSEAVVAPDIDFASGGQGS